MITLYCATKNPGKLREFRLASAHFGFEGIAIEPVPGLESLPAPDETGSTFEENAILKATAYSLACDGWVFADDSGLEVDCLHGAPGVYSARFAGEGASDADNNRLLLERVKPHEVRAARFVCVIALARRGELLTVVRGVVEGRIVDEERGPNGFGYDPLFFHEPFGCTFGEVSNERKMNVSHRGQALHALLRFCAGLRQV